MGRNFLAKPYNRFWHERSEIKSDGQGAGARQNPKILIKFEVATEGKMLG